MEPFDEKDDSRSPDTGRPAGRRAPRNDSWDHGAPDIPDLAPDDLGTTRCDVCGKWIIEGTVRCPYCKHLVLEDRQSNRSLWFVLTAIVGLLMIGGYFLCAALGIVARLHR